MSDDKEMKNQIQPNDFPQPSRELPRMTDLEAKSSEEKRSEPKPPKGEPSHLDKAKARNKVTSAKRKASVAAFKKAAGIDGSKLQSGIDPKIREQPYRSEEEAMEAILKRDAVIMTQVLKTWRESGDEESQTRLPTLDEQIAILSTMSKVVPRT